MEFSKSNYVLNMSYVASVSKEMQIQQKKEKLIQLIKMINCPALIVARLITHLV